MNILVTGAAGFVGSEITDKFIELGHKVTIIDNLSTGLEANINPNAEFVKADINDDLAVETIKKSNLDIIIHCAAQMNVRYSVEYPKIDAKNNIIGTINILEAARKYGVKKVVFASSGGTVYGDQDYFPADEEHRLRPCSPYGITKVACEKYLYYYKQVYGLNYVAYRYGNIYGERQNPKGEAGVIAIFTEKMLNREQPVINGDGSITRDYVYIKDVVKANVLALNDEVSGVFNITTGVETSTNQIFTLLKELTGSDCKEFHGPAKPGEQKRSVCSYQKIYDMFKWKPDYDLRGGMRETVDAVKKKMGL